MKSRIKRTRDVFKVSTVANEVRANVRGLQMTMGRHWLELEAENENGDYICIDIELEEVHKFINTLNQMARQHRRLT